MRVLFFAAAASLAVTTLSAQEIARPNLLLREVVQGMPKGDRQEIRVFDATIQPNGRTVFHTHRFPVTLFIVSGTFTLEMEGHPTAVLKAGETFVEPPNVRMTGYNRSASEPMRAIIFYVSDPDTPFFDLSHAH